ncbi:hypothetical protein ZWY2020_016763 [Hordeum vulgare]|nr:hypothetical protein ZWY2020_016763 [Hordeum vulgare]
MNGPATATKMNTCTVMKLEVCKYGESGGCGPNNNVMSKSIFCVGACHVLIDHSSHKHNWRTSKVTCRLAAIHSGSTSRRHQPSL